MVEKGNNSLIRIFLALLNVGYGLRAKPVGDLVGAQGDPKDVLVVAVLILDTVDVTLTA